MYAFIYIKIYTIHYVNKLILDVINRTNFNNVFFNQE